MKVLIAGGGTGGHLMPALAIGAALRELEVEVVLVGAERGVETSILPCRDFPFHLLPLEPIYRREWWKNFKWALIGPKLLSRCIRLLKDESPDLVVGTGGYASGPVLFAARILGIPFALQEQNALPGIATRWLAPHARQVHLGFPEAADLLNVKRGEIFDFGNPVSPPDEPRRDRREMKKNLGIDPSLPVVFITGASQGSLAINRAVAGMLNDGKLSRFGFTWSTGAATWNEFSHFTANPNVVVREFWDPISEAYATADLIVSRAGAMSTAEFCAWGLPSVLIPLPSSAADHQTTNAVALERAGVAKHLPQEMLNPASLAATISELFEAGSQLDDMGRLAAERGQPDSAGKIASQLVEIVS